VSGVPTQRKSSVTRAHLTLAKGGNAMNGIGAKFPANAVTAMSSPSARIERCTRMGVRRTESDCHAEAIGTLG
jgi:hypothetical protein